MGKETKEAKPAPWNAVSLLTLFAPSAKRAKGERETANCRKPDASEGLLLGFDIGGTKSAVVLGNTSGEVVAREECATSGPEETLGWMIETARHFFQIGQPQACGISCGGPLSSRRGVILSPPNLPGWDEIPAVEQVHAALGIPVRLENDANAAALAEWNWGLGRRVSDLVYLTCGTGQGAGIIVDGRLVRGRQDLAGEIGHVRLRPSGPVGFGKAGSVEGLTSGKALGVIARLMLDEAHGASSLDALPREQVDGQAVTQAALEGDAFALQVVRTLGGYLGETCAMLIDLLNPQRISLGSLALRLGGLLLEPVIESARREALPAAFEACEIAPAALGQRTQDLAALGVATTS